VTADTLDFGACLSRCVLMGPLREHSFELKGYLLRTNIIPHSVLQDCINAAVFCIYCTVVMMASKIAEVRWMAAGSSGARRWV
jgi:hypothetical protein